MDNRLRSLYCTMTEMWGRVRGAWRGDGMPRISTAGPGEANPPRVPEGVMWTER